MSGTDERLPVTVVIPARNAAASLAETLATVLQQSVGSPSVVVVDDGSTDATASIAAGFGPDVTVCPGRSAGPGAARNDGAALASTEYLAFCDADDRWPADRLGKDLAILAEEPAIGILLGRTRFDADDPSLLARMNFEGADRSAIIPHFGAATMRTAIFSGVGPIDETLANYEDYEWFLRAREVPGRLVTHDRIVQWSWRHADSTSHLHPATPQDMLRLLQRSVRHRRLTGAQLASLTALRREPS